MKPAWIDRQPRWLLASLAAAAFATVLAGCGAPTTQSAPRPRRLPASRQREGLLGGTSRAELGVSSDPGHLETEPIFSLAAGWQVVF
ncbi:MAG: hypothetical protein OXH85_10335 [Truepera sp.]|nr:hypothetical protein [Truepera sp.]